LGNGKLDRRTGEGSCFSLTEVTTQEALKAIKIKEKEFFTTPMAIIIQANGKTTKLMDTDHMFHQVEDAIRGIGRMLRNTEQVNRSGKTEQYFRDSTNLTKRVELANFSMEMEIDMSVNSSLIKRMGKE
jgi:hypothetical protein